MNVENFEGDIIMGLLRLKTRGLRTLPSILHLRAIGRTTGLQRVRQQFDPVLPPKYRAVEHIDRRTEHIGRNLFLAVFLEGGADLVVWRTLDQYFSGKARF